MKGPNVPNKPDVTVQEKSESGFANAFRILDQPGEDCFVDFLVYSAVENRAEVVTRVRVRKELLLAIRDRLNQTIASPSPFPESEVN